MGYSYIYVLGGWGVPDDQTGELFSRFDGIEISDLKAMARGAREYTYQSPNGSLFVQSKQIPKPGQKQFFNLKSGLYRARVDVDIFYNKKTKQEEHRFLAFDLEKAWCEIEDLFTFLRGGDVSTHSTNEVSGGVSKGFNVAAT